MVCLAADVSQFFIYFAPLPIFHLSNKSQRRGDDGDNWGIFNEREDNDDMVCIPEGYFFFLFSLFFLLRGHCSTVISLSLCCTIRRVFLDPARIGAIHPCGRRAAYDYLI